ncbi:DNA-directed RNA polymerase, beta subunit family protein [Tritrichomonas foetus]|uniref:DNA-directed RNA polymerase subunit beta n=1 Tax=Tritrichomonas foetus TaxID=1144522 RepID=A0A1J4KUR6_9EUKA|nr:DNA-directed RNA polymerase, beta subunit family protein [Tritrichomonas foetus]|eukprot:OHT13406.1 DNA-directed RNA polymerase, beta subunit family protein [Tritrichomonas foetus]
MEAPRPAEEQAKDLCEFLAPHLESFNWAVTSGLKNLPKWLLMQELKRSDEDSILKIKVTNLDLSRPHNDRAQPIYPYQCRLGGTTYGGVLKVDLDVKYGDLPTHKTSVFCENIPIMVNSCLCHLNGMSPSDKTAILEEETESGGYFVAGGYDKILRLLILNRQNYVFALERGSFGSRGNNFTNMATSLRSVAPDCSSVTTNVHYLSTGNMMVLFPIQRRMFFVPLPVVLRALIECDDQSIYLSITEGKNDTFVNDRVIAMLRYSAEMGLLTQAQARDYLGAHFARAVQAPSHFNNDMICQLLLDRYLFPHLTGKSPTAKFNLLIFMAKRLLSLVKGDIRPDNMDAACCHELLTPGTLWLAVLSDAISDFLRGSIFQIQRDESLTLGDYARIDSVLNKSCGSVEKKMRHLFSTGQIRGNSTLGLSQVDGLSIIAERINYMRYLAHFRSVHRGAFFTTMKTTAVRKLLPESWGFMCPVHTPDGGLCGLLNHLARNCKVVCGEPRGAEEAKKVLVQNGMVPFITNGVPVIIDGEILGTVPDTLAEHCVASLKRERLNGNVAETVEIVSLPAGGFTRSIYVFTNQQRMMRPVMNNTAKKVEFIGPLEQIFMLIGALPTDTDKPYCEIHQTSMLSLVASLTPFSDFNQSPRNMYQCQMAKQTMGYPQHNESTKTESKTYHVHYPQRPIVRNSTQDSHGLLDFPLGTNAVVAVLSYTGYDMEDALILNKASVERGFGHGCIYKTHRYIAKEIEPNGIFTNIRDGQIIDNELDKDGLPFVGAKVHAGSKILRVENTKDRKERIMRYKDGEDGFVDKVITTSDDSGKITSVVIKFRMVRTPTIGDKFSSRHGQKGVFSFPWPEENMPFTGTGMRPDVIINPHAFPSRMTIGMLIESMCGKVQASDLCESVDATPFQYSEDFRATEEIGKKLVERGFNYYGNEVLYSGITGEQFKADIFLGVVYYQRLRHMVGDKYQVRATGRINNLTRQPLKGRKKGGGIRLGEMERDGLLAQGVSFLLRDRFMWCSDGCTAHLCKKCGSFMFTQTKKEENGFEETSCNFCNSKDKITTVYIPYVLKYLVAEFAAMNIRLKFEVDEDDE